MNLILLMVMIGIWIFGRYLPTPSFLNHLTIDQQVLLAVLASMIVPTFFLSEIKRMWQLIKDTDLEPLLGLMWMVVDLLLLFSYAVILYAFMNHLIMDF